MAAASSTSKVRRYLLRRSSLVAYAILLQRVGMAGACVTCGGRSQLSSVVQTMPA